MGNDHGGHTMIERFEATPEGAVAMKQARYEAAFSDGYQQALSRVANVAQFAPTEDEQQRIVAAVNVVRATPPSPKSRRRRREAQPSVPAESPSPREERDEQHG